MDAHLELTSRVFAAVHILDRAGLPLPRERSGGGPEQAEEAAARAAEVLEAGRSRARRLLDELGSQPCTVCLEGTSPDEDVCLLPCLHAFHTSCVEAWLQSHGTCPNCRVRAQDGGDDASDDGGCGQGGAPRAVSGRLPEA
mmetsp:Transcript_8629/g.25457  ORF Transcript_8629/g.25457 Transcript_8629/m.25457 type:complete len:141 (+) Transcript_8629:269-691(+)